MTQLVAPAPNTRSLPVPNRTTRNNGPKPAVRSVASPNKPTPAAELNVPALHSELAIGLTTLFGGVLAGAMLIARNHALMGQKADGFIFLFGTVCWQAILVMISCVFPQVVGYLWLPLLFGQAILFQQIAKHTFAKPYAAIKQGRGKWAAKGLAVAAVVVTTVGLASVFFVIRAVLILGFGF